MMASITSPHCFDLTSLLRHAASHELKFQSGVDEAMEEFDERI